MGEEQVQNTQPSSGAVNVGKSSCNYLVSLNTALNDVRAGSNRDDMLGGLAKVHGHPGPCAPTLVFLGRSNRGRNSRRRSARGFTPLHLPSCLSLGSRTPWTRPADIQNCRWIKTQSCIRATVVQLPAALSVTLNSTSRDGWITMFG